MSDDGDPKQPRPDDLLVGLIPPTEPESGTGGLQPASEPAGAREAGESDVDPARAADIRGLAVAIRTARSAGSQAASAASESSPQMPGLTLGHAEREDPSKVDIGVGSITDAMSLLPDPAQAESPEERAAREAALREAEARQAAAARAAARLPRKDATEELSELDLAAEEVRPSRLKWFLLGGGVVVVLVAAGTTYGLLARRADRARAAARQLQQRYADKVDDLVARQARRSARAGTHVDPFAGVLARTPDVVRRADVDPADQALNQSVPELDRWFEQALRRMSKRKARGQLAERGAALVKLGQHRRGRRYLFRAIRIRDGADVRLALGRSFLAEKQPRAAIAHLKRAVALARRQRSRTRARLLLSHAYLEAGKTAAACKLLRRVRGRSQEAGALWADRCAGSAGKSDGAGQGGGR